MDFNDRVSFTFNNQCTRTFLRNWGYFLVSVGIYRNFFLINNGVKEFCPEISVPWFLSRAGGISAYQTAILKRTLSKIQLFVIIMYLTILPQE